MTDLERILSLWRELHAAGADYVLATVVAVEGPSYRKPGALMLLSADGRRAGTVSGGCLEAEVASRAWWLTESGPTIQHYSTADDDGDRPYGSGCGGVVFLLLERRVTADTLLAALDLSFARRISFSVATVLEGENLACRAFAGLKNEPTEDSQTPAGSGPSIFHRSFEDEALQKLAEQSLTNRQPLEKQIEFGRSSVKARADYRPARPALGIFGAGDDAQPLLRLAKNLGWFVSVADGRSHLATPQRFPSADQISVLPMDQLPGSLAPQSSSATSRAAFAHLQREDAVVVMTHSFEQDAKILACLLASEAPPAYIGVLGPQRRTRELLAEAATLLHLPPTEISTQPDRWLARLHAPTGLDLGAEAPETIALSILAEIQKFRAKASALPMRQVRAASVALAG